MKNKVVTVHQALMKNDPGKYKRVLDLQSPADIKARGAEIENLQKELDNSLKEVQQLKELQVELDDVLDRTKKQLDDAKKEIQKLKEDRKGARKKIQKLKEEKVK